MTASVVSMSATDAARANQVFVAIGRGVVPEAVLALADRVDHDGAFDSAVVRDLPERLLERAPDDVHAVPPIVVERERRKRQLLEVETEISAANIREHPSMPEEDDRSILDRAFGPGHRDAPCDPPLRSQTTPSNRSDVTG